MGRLRLADGYPGQSQYMNIPTDYGTTISMRKDLFLGELCALSEGEAYEVLAELEPYNDYLGLGIEDVETVVEYGKKLLDMIRKKNPDTAKPGIPDAVTFATEADAFNAINTGQMTYAHGALYLGPNHPWSKNPMMRSRGIVPGVYLAPAPDYVIAKLDPEFAAAMAAGTAAPAGSGSKPGSPYVPAGPNPNPNVPPGDPRRLNFNVGVNNRPTVLDGEWWQNPWVIAGGAALLIFLIYLGTKR